MKGQILVIDDNPIDIKVIVNTVEKSGFACFGYTNYLDAFEWYKSNSPQLIMLDLQMPEISGYQLITKFRETSKGQSIPIIIVSGKTQSEDVKKAIQLGANDYILKPLDPMVLQEKVNSVVSNNAEDFFTVSIPAGVPSKATFNYPLQIQTLSEFGLRVTSEHQVKPGVTLEITGISRDIFGSDKLMVRCLSSEANQEQKNYSIQFTYVGISEANRQKIRRYCRMVYANSKRAV